MNTMQKLAMLTGLGLLIAGSPAWAVTPVCKAPGCNPTASDGFHNTAGGTDALLNDTTGPEGDGSYNTAFGNDALFSNTFGNYNAANGALALYSNTTGRINTATGAYALYRNT